MITATPGTQVTATLEGPPAATVLTARLRDGQTILQALTVTPRLDPSGDPLDIFDAALTVPAALPAAVEWLESGTRVSYELITAPATAVTGYRPRYLEGAPAGLTITARLRDGDETLPYVVAVTPVLDADGDPLDAYKAIVPEPFALPVTLQWLEDGEVVGTDLIAAEIPPGPFPWAPSLAQVAAILRARTRGPASRDAQTAGEQGVFTHTTRPTAAQVFELIAIACGELSGLMQGREPCTATLSLSAATAAAYRAAMLCEVSYYPEQTGDDTTAFKALATMWKDASKTVSTAVLTQCPLVPLGPGEVDTTGWPIGRVPCFERTGWATRW